MSLSSLLGKSHIALETILLHGLSWENQLATTIQLQTSKLSISHLVSTRCWWYNKLRLPKSITFANATKHLLWYAIQREDGSYFYPFAEHKRFTAYLWATTCQFPERVYIKHSPGHTSLTMGQLLDISRNLFFMKVGIRPFILLLLDLSFKFLSLPNTSLRRLCRI
jgi:hypothetical protein